MTKTTSNQFINTVCYKTDMNSLKKVREINKKLAKQFEKSSMNQIKGIKKVQTEEQKLAAQKKQDIKKMDKLHALAFKMNIRYDQKIASAKARYDNTKENRINNYLLSLKGVDAAEKISIRNQLREIKNLDKMNRRMRQLKLQAGKVKIGGKSGLSKGGKAIPMSSRAGGVGVGVAATGAVVGGGTMSMVNLITSQSTALRELSNQAHNARMSVEDFQVVSRLGVSFGVNSDMLSEALFDISDKFGDFFAIDEDGKMAKAGEAKHAIAVLQKQGMTLKQIKKLKPAEVMQKLNKAMKEQNMTANEQTFIYEALSSNSAKAGRIWDNNGDLIKRTEKNMRDLNQITSEQDITTINKGGVEIAKMSKAVDKLKNDFLVAFLGADGLEKTTKSFTTTLNNITDGVKGMGRAIRKEVDSVVDAMETITNPDMSLWDKWKSIADQLGVNEPNGGFTLDFENSPMNKMFNLTGNHKNNPTADEIFFKGDQKPYPFNQTVFTGGSNYPKPYNPSILSTQHTVNHKNTVKVKVELDTDLFTTSVENIANNALQDTYADAASTMSPDS